MGVLNEKRCKTKLIMNASNCTNNSVNLSTVMQIVYGNQDEIMEGFNRDRIMTDFPRYQYEYYCWYDNLDKVYIVCGVNLDNYNEDTVVEPAFRFSYKDCEDALLFLDVLLQDISGDVTMRLYDGSNISFLDDYNVNNVNFETMIDAYQQEVLLFIKEFKGAYDDKFYNKMTKNLQICCKSQIAK